MFLSKSASFQYRPTNTNYSRGIARTTSLSSTRVYPIPVGLSISKRFIGETNGKAANENPEFSETMLDREKKKVLEGKTVTTVENAPGWNYRLASNSEAYIKADKEPDKPMEELIQESMEVITKLDESDGYPIGTMDKSDRSNNRHTNNNTSKKYQREKLPTDVINPS